MNIIEGITHDGKPVAGYKFNSVAEMVAQARINSDPNATSQMTEAEFDSFNDPFFGTDNFDQAVDLALNGWTSQRPAVDSTLEPVREALRDKMDLSTIRYHDVSGGEVDIARFCDDDPECMYEDWIEEAPKMGKVITLHLNGTVTGGTRQDEIQRRGAAICALVEAMQWRGFDLEIWCEYPIAPSTTNGKYGTFTTLVKVHSAGDPLDINNVLFPLGHPSMLRRMIFALMEGGDAEFRRQWSVKAHGGYGMVRQPPLMIQEVGASIVLTHGGRHAREVADPTAWVLEQLAAQGVYDPEDGDDD